MRTVARLALVLTAAIGLTSTAAEATTIPFTDRVLFDTAVFGTPGVAVEGWELYPTDTVIANGSTLNGITYAFASGDGRVAANYLPLSSPHTLGKVATTGPDFFVGGESVGFGFAQPILAFGISINTFATAAGEYQFAAFSGGSLVGFASSGLDPFPGLTTGQFVGLISDTPFDFVAFASTGAFAYTLDDLTYVATPEPATLLLLAGGLVPLVRRRSRKR